jgi:two-component system chemotaxis sensor kinase CheA
MVVVLQGEETEVDKGRGDLLDAPLTHLVRNCADHGIEMPEEREKAGKPARGTITLKASADESWFTLEVSDDGRGLNLEAIRKKGESLGLIKAGESLSEQVLIDLIFASGLSTAQKVTDVSGRGVGMDVVKRQIQEAGGTVCVTTQTGKGTTFCLRVPSAVSTQIIQAFLVRDDDGIYALPMEIVRESFVDEKASSGIGVVTRHGQVLPVAPLGTLMGSSTSADAGRRTFVTLERLGLTLAVSVDETLGVRRLVICPLRGLCADDSENLFQGAALMGDGRMALVVDPDHLFRLLRQESEIS